MRLPQLDYIQIFKDAWNITWKNKFLWWFGFFVTIGGAGGSLNYSFDPNNSSETEQEMLQKAFDFFSIHSEVIIIGLAILCLIFLALFFLGLIGEGALIKSIYKIIQNEKADYSSGFPEGKKYWKKILFLNILLFLSWLAIIIVLATPIVFLFVQKSFIFAIILLIIALFLLVPLVFLSIFIKNYGTLYIVLGQLQTIPAIEKSYDLFLSNISASTIFVLFFIPLGLVAFIIMLFSVLPIVVFFLIIGLGLYFFIGKIATFICAGIGIIILLIDIFFLKSIWEVFASTSWVLFFQKIASQKIKEMVTEKVPETKKEILSEIETVKTVKIDIEEK
jgi:hypothetical protein